MLSVLLYETRGMQAEPVTGDAPTSVLSSVADHVDTSGVNVRLLGSLVDTLVAEIAGRVKATVKFLTRGADWKTKRRAEGLADFTDAVFRLPQGEYQNIWCLTPEIAKDCLIFGEGWIEVGSRCVDSDDDDEEYDITFSRQFPWEMLVDQNEARYGRPRNLFRMSAMSVDDALSRFVDEMGLKGAQAEKARTAIEGAEDADDFGHTARVCRMIRVVEAWHAKRGKSPGRHIICVNGTCLFDEEWDREGFPFARIVWEKERVGHYGRGLVEQMESIHIELNENIRRLSDRLRLMGCAHIYVAEGSVDLAVIQNNDEATIIPYTGNQPPTETRPDPIGPSELQFVDRILNFGYSMSGISEMKASSRKEPGVDSGIAIRLMNDQQSGRFAIFASAYEQLHVDCASAAIAEARAITANGNKVRVRSQKRGEFDFNEVELPDRQVDITSHPASALSTDPAQRIATAEQLFGSGLISGPVFLRLIQLPDLESELNQQTIQERYADWAVMKLLDAEDEEDYVAPDPLIPNKPMVMLYVANAYFEALIDGAPELNLQLMRTFVADLSAEIDRLEAEKAAQMAPPPPPPGAEMMPPPGAMPPEAMLPPPPLQ
jgi:hypothetical protein